MRITPCGVRGTAVAANPAFMEFGGDTTCFLVEGHDGELVQVDAGSGTRGANARLRHWTGKPALLLLMTHYHLDHLLGFPWLSVLYNARWSLEIAAPLREGRAAGDVVPRILEAPYWPVHMDEMRAAVRFTTLAQPSASTERILGGLIIRWCALHHSGGCTAYRFDEPATGNSAVIATDFEWDASTPDEKQALLQLCATPHPAQALLLDGQFTPADYERHRGWGHSRWSDAVEIARQAGAGALHITHHAPAADDSLLRTVEAEMRARMPTAALLRQSSPIILPRRAAANAGRAPGRSAGAPERAEAADPRNPLVAQMRREPTPTPAGQ